MGRVKDWYMEIQQTKQSCRDILEDLLESHEAEDVLEAMQELQDKMK